MQQLLTGVALAGLAAATYSDLRTREVPDWLNYGMIAAGVGLRVIWAAASFDIMILVEGLLGLLLFFLVASLMYYGGQWGGGDAKMLMGLGCLMGFGIPKSWTLQEIPDLAVFWIILLFSGALYGLGASMVLSVRNFRALRQRFLPLFAKNRIRLAALMLLALASAGGSRLSQDPFLRIGLLSLSGVAAFTALLWIYVKAVEEVCMVKDYPLARLTEGDWIAEDVVVGGKRICGPKDLGISREQIATLKELAGQKKILTVKVKEGIPFLPPFLIAFMLTWVWPAKEFLFSYVLP